ncbi:putative ABC transporter ATP-binding protein/permease [Lachnellula hyalina]|uniref:Putative ABC transporter ATP-binding protein/permease n=1 Tax=Lachnellula hyalina TaxID=1316788 RepID=A0A8H8QWE3_9HELO|nr:putative ABC transporter ATP-binding protein/permease [Lachnellula hyalina]TVY22935.1 putative ABC transporter ATP-binding protein/permease [Lachnellula hyalina]
MLEKDIEAGVYRPGGNNGSVAQNASTESNAPTVASILEPSLNPQLSTATSNHLSLSEVEPVDVQIRNLSVVVDTSPSAFSLENLRFGKRRKHQDGEPEAEKKQVLHSVAASMPAGSLTAIIGGSGSGKTTLLNTMAKRMTSSRLAFGGTTTFNGMEGVSIVRSAYVMQQDVLLPTLTVRETLQYSADLRLPPPTRGEERRKVVEEVILELGLKECADTRIGNHQHKGCSGGEKRRTSIGVQLLSNPSVLFLDEPTTGLDATSAFQLVRTLKSLAKRGRTIITTIHQPRSEIWGMFDGLIILTRGSPVFSGKADDCIPWFKSLGMDLPAFVNPAEFLIDIAAVDNRSPELETSSSARVEHLKHAWAVESDKVYSALDEKPTAATRTKQEVVPRQTSNSRLHSPFIRQTRVLTSRTFKTTLRDPMGMTGSVVEAIGMGIMTGWVFLSLGRDQSGIRSREGALYTAAALQGYLILVYETYRLTIDIQLFDREHNENVVDVIPFLLSRRIARFVTEDFPVPLIYSVIFYWMAGFRADASAFLTFFAVVLLCQYIAVTYAMTCVAAIRDFSGASLIGNLGYTIQSMACGFFIQANAIPVYVRWLKWTAYVFYAFGALAANEFVGQFYNCPLSGGESNPACAQYTGEYIMASLGFPKNWVVRPIIILVAFSVMFYSLAGLGLRYMRVEMSIARARNTDTDLSAGKEKMTIRSAEEVRSVDIVLDKFALDLDKRSTYGKKLPTKTILHPISAHFQPGMLNVIMGPSGSGKTSLLNAIALRLHNSIGTQYRGFGDMRFNGAVPSDSVIRSVCSYVCQDDDALLPSLTVRETLRFSAGLRLPSFMTTAEKHDRAEEVLLKLGLKDCADNLIGSDLIKGISGGEKRRVSIAVQILTDPRVLLLDEPTSGLDAFTASSIMEVLQGLSNEGRTLILTIHQSRSDLFKHFGTVLLLARGGSPVYAGNAVGMLPHFDRLGYPCPTTTNPADFALDLITIDLQQSSREEATRSKVRDLITSWSSGDFNEAYNPTMISTPAELGALVRKPTSFLKAYPILVNRASINFSRQPPLLTARIMQVLGLGIILTLFFAPLKHDYFSVQNRVGFIQEFCAFYFVGMLQNVAIYPNEKDVFYRENDDGTYGVEAFLAQYITLEVPFEIFTSLLFAILADLAAGLPRTPQMFFAVFFNCFCVVSCGESVGIMFNTLFAHTGFAINVTSVFLSIAQVMSGVLSINMPGFLQGVNYLSPMRYVTRNLIPYSLRHMAFHCTAAQRLPDGTCPITTGEQVLDLYALDTNPAINIMALGICTLVYRLLAYALLKGMRTHWGKSKIRHAGRPAAHSGTVV